MYLQQDKRQIPVYLLMALFLFSLLFTACNAPLTHTKPQPLPTLTADPGWKIVLQAKGDATNQHEGASKSFSLGQVPGSVLLRLSITCTGQGSASANIEAPHVAATWTACTDTPQTTRVEVPTEQYNIPQARIPVNLTIRGSAKWEALVEEPVSAA